jgi:phage terminase large subunit-like protein
VNEASEVPLAARNILLTRLAQKCFYEDGSQMKSRFIIDLNPPSKNHWTYKLFIQKLNPEDKTPLTKPNDYFAFQLNPVDNIANQREGFVEELAEMSERNKQRFLYGNFVDENSEALFSYETFEECRTHDVPDFLRIVISVDPSGASNSDEKNDAIGIIVMGLGTDNKGYLIEDLTLKASPDVWSKVVSDAYERHDADLVVAEVNYGGGLVHQTIKTHNPNIAYKALTSTRGKHIRAEPVSILYKQGKICHVGKFPDLEDELLNFTNKGYEGDRSPNRADALVFAVQELFNGIVNPRQKVKPLLNSGISYNKSGWMR